MLPLSRTTWAQLVEILGGSTEAYAHVLPQVVCYLRRAVELLQLAQPSPLPPPSGSATPVASSPDHTGEDHSDPSPAGSVDQEAVAGEPATPPPQLAAPPPAVVARQRRRRRIAGGDAGAEAGPSARRPRSGRVCVVCMLVCILQAVGTGSTRSSQPTAQPAHAGGYIRHYTEGERGGGGDGGDLGIWVLPLRRSCLQPVTWPPAQRQREYVLAVCWTDVPDPAGARTRSPCASNRCTAGRGHQTLHPAGFHGPKPPGVSQGSLQVHPHASHGEQPCGDPCPAQDRAVSGGAGPTAGSECDRLAAVHLQPG